MRRLGNMLVKTLTQNLIFLVCIVVWLTLALKVRKEKKQLSFCLAQNPLIGMLKDNKVKVFDIARPSSSGVCASEWRKHQTCCLPTSLITYAERDMKTLRNTLSGVKKNAHRLLKFVNENKKLIFGALKRKAIKLQPSFVQEFKDELNASLTSIRAVLEEENKAATVSLNKCFERIQEIKTNSLCYTCSGRSAHFFLKGRALMGIDDCRKTVDKCADTWGRSIKLIDAMEVSRKFHQKLKRIIPDEKNTLQINVKNIQKLQNWIGSHDIREKVKECDHSLDSCSDASAKSLCESFISLRPKDFLSKVGGSNVNPVPQVWSFGLPIRGIHPPMISAPQISQGSRVWALGGTRVLAGDKQKSPEQPICFDIKQDIQVVKCNQTEKGNAPMTLSGRILSTDSSESTSGLQRQGANPGLDLTQP